MYVVQREDGMFLKGRSWGQGWTHDLNEARTYRRRGDATASGRLATGWYSRHKMSTYMPSYLGFKVLYIKPEIIDEPRKLTKDYGDGFNIAHLSAANLMFAVQQGKMTIQHAYETFKRIGPQSKAWRSSDY